MKASFKVHISPDSPNHLGVNSFKGWGVTVALDHPGPSYLPEFSFNKHYAQAGAEPKNITISWSQLRKPNTVLLTGGQPRDLSGASQETGES